MTLHQLNLLTEDELAIILHMVNEIAPPGIPPIKMEPKHLVWFRHDMLIKKLVDNFDKLNVEGHATYTSLMAKLGVTIEIKKIEPKDEQGQNSENTGSNQCPPSQSLSSDGSNLTGSNAPCEPA